MTNSITAKNLRTNLKTVLERASEGYRTTIIYRSVPLAEIVPIGTADNQRGNYDRTAYLRALDEATGSSTAKDVTTPDQDKPVLRKRLIAKHGR